MSSPHDTLNLPQSLGNGLALRLATPDDTEALAEFNTLVHLEEGEPPDFLRDWTRVLMSGDHPTTSAADFVVIENAEDHKIVSAACLIPQVWAYDGIDFKVGRPELVGTDPAYRRRGLSRKIFETIHALSAAYGHQVQGITGIPWFYRQFGYEYALELGGRRDLPIAGTPELKEGEIEP
jgi:GNAT superfamily N-acetyltransferase